MSKIVAVHYDGDSISQYKLDNGSVLDREQAVQACDEGRIEGCSSFTTRDGSAAIRSDRGQEGYSLDSLPTF